MEMPQSGERVVGRDSMRAMQQAFPNYGGEAYYVANIVEFRDDRISRRDPLL
jgi:hypothetical protein